ncbi:MAG: hypothetical protein O4805_11520 [Trichodesmium sp. St16_bin2-tuft]|nr:hypothetical protein [Trichodesmium sp. St5_bin2_1]MDE5087729.1 hypothetical protein [Trichodesmium sp. St16_bin2-tuft]MDE5108119.1 hypothetical protein [Trichodesmium sp. St17_bin3_1_1]MDE5120265.1 hypothetical protein [Trichodesmium sp. St19_bin1]
MRPGKTRECLWMSNRRRPQLKEEVNIKMSNHDVLCRFYEAV